MDRTLSHPNPIREVIWPREHGSWSLALEPLALGLLVAPSGGGAALGAAAVALFFSRRPIRIALHDPKPERRTSARQALGGCAGIAIAALVAALWLGRFAWWLWLVPSVVAGLVFAAFDLRQSGREQAAEVAGAFAFGWMPAVFAALAGWPPLGATALGVVMLVRAVPTVLVVRASVRLRKGQAVPVVVPVLAVLVALGAAGAFVRGGAAPWSVVVLAALLAARTLILLVYPRLSIRASTLGLTEAVLGVVYVGVVALTWGR